MFFFHLNLNICVCLRFFNPARQGIDIYAVSLGVVLDIATPKMRIASYLLIAAFGATHFNERNSINDVYDINTISYIYIVYLINLSKSV